MKVELNRYFLRCSDARFIGVAVHWPVIYLLFWKWNIALQVADDDEEALVTSV